MSDLPPRSDAGEPLAATRSVHGDFLEKAVPQWLVDATPARRSALKRAAPVLPSGYKNASPERRKALNASLKASAIAQVQLDTSMATFLDVDAFARPLLLKALKDQYQVEVDVDKTFLCLRRPLAISVAEVEISSFELLKLSMLQAALHNFEAWECKPSAYHETSGFVLETTTAGTYESTTVNVTVSQFMTVCRRLDIGAQYQTYLKAFFAPVDASPEPPLRQHFIASQKATLKAAADYALITGDIEAADHAMIVSVVNGNLYPTIGSKRVWLLDLSLMKKRLTGCVYFAIGDKYSDELILYIPHDPAHPLKRYTKQHLRDEFKRLFTAREGMSAHDPAPTAYQRFFSQFVPYDQRPYYFSQFTQKSADSPSSPLISPWRTFVQSVLGTSALTQIKELPPEKPAKMEPVDDPYIQPGSMMPYRGTGTFSGLLDLWPFLYEKHRDKILADARAHAVPTADVDAKAREAKLAHLLEVGMLALNLVSMFVPVLGEIMIAVMVEQLLSETLEGSIEWAEGDKRAAKAHLIDVAENLAQIAVMAGVGAAVSRFRAAKAVPVIENLSPVILPNGETRLWKPDLKGYESAVTLQADAVPNAQGQHTLNGKTYIRQGDQVYEQVFDESIKQWRIKHPTNAEVYQPILQSNARGAWRHTLEQPSQWDRLTLLRRIGHETEAFSDAELIKVADVSGVSDSALRKMHMDLAAPPPELQDALRLFKADAGSGQVIEQLRGSQPIDERYLFVLPLVAEMPRWPAGRALEVFKGAQFSGESLRYGAGRAPRGAAAKAPIQITRADVLGGRLPAVILAALDESETTSLLGAEAARVRDVRPQEFGKQIADFAQTRKAAIFDSLYAGTEPLDSQVTLLQRTCPGLSEAAARETLAHASPQDLKRLNVTRRVPLTVLEEARWYAREGRQTRAYAGLRSETMASTDSRRLALHTLEKLPGWPDTLRLEIREGTESGLLLDSIGSDTARDKKYLVKKGPRFQAFNDRGEELNSLPIEGDNFYASLMHALPDEARRGLGVPQVSQSAQLQAKIIEGADLYRYETPQLLEPKRKGFKPPARINDTLVGYYASGRAPGLSFGLASRAQDLYGLSDAQASAYIKRLRVSGKDDKAIFNHLQTRGRDYQTLVSSLDEWVEAQGRTDDYAYQTRSHVANQLKDAWRKEPVVGTVYDAESLYVSADEHLPPLTVDFQHIRKLTLVGRKMSDAGAEAFLARFPNVESLSIGDVPPLFGSTQTGPRLALTTVPPAVTRMTGLKKLKFSSAADQLAPDFSSTLNSLTSLEALHIQYRGFSATVLNSLDLSALQQLKRLNIDAPVGLSQWPANVENLPRLEHLDLSRTAVSTLPAGLYSGHEQLWTGLSMDWSRFPRETFKPAYEYVKNYKGEHGHLVDLHEMVSSYANGELKFLNADSSVASALHKKIMTTAYTPEERFAAIEDISRQYNALFSNFYDPSAVAALRFRFRADSWRTGSNAHVISALETNWWGAQGERYGIPSQASTLELPAPQLQGTVPLMPVGTVELPPLPAASFAHVRTLRMRWLGESTEQTRGFIRAFSGAQTLELNGSGLTEIPIGAGDLPALTRLDLSNNSLVMPALQAQLNELGSLEQLDLSHNSKSLTNVDVSALTQLKALNLRGTTLKAWPTGAERLPSLTWLDLRDNQLSSLPPQVLTDDALLMKTNVAGNRFSPTGEVELESARQRVETDQGLPKGALARFEQQRVPNFPPQETGLTMARYLLLMPLQVEAAEGAAGFVSRLQELAPSVTEQKALQWFEQLRTGGMSDAQIDSLLATRHQELKTLTRELNGWQYTRDLQGPIPDLVLAQRRRVALKVVECWQTGVSAQAGYELSLHGLLADTLPELSVQFDRVHTLDLTGVQCSTSGAEGFLNGFPALRKLVLSGNQLAAVPEAVGRMAQLEELDLAVNALTDPVLLYRQLGGERLRRLNLSKNNLRVFSTQTFSRLEALDLSYNGITQWPDAALDAANLRTLNLSGNDLTTLPDELLDGSHDALVSGTDISENESLSLDSLEQMRRYSDRHQRGPVMGWSREEIDRWIDGFERGGDGSDSNGDDDDDDDDYEPLEPIPDPQGVTDEAALTPWLAHSPADGVASRRLLWQQLAQEPEHERFFHLLERLRDTHEYRFVGADLTRRVWAVIDAAASSEQLRGAIFTAAQTHGTCGDGRILTFSSMEVVVFEADVLREVPAHDLRLRGQSLFDLSRRLFRLDQVNTLAERNAVGQDWAEVHLQYRIAMTRGWPDGLELPGQPTHMMHAVPISGEVLANARNQVLLAEASDAFYESLIAREYWVRYLEERYPDEFQAFDSDDAMRSDALEEEHADRVRDTDSQTRYDEALTQREVDRGRTKARLLLELSRREALALGVAPVVTPPSRPLSPQPGPSTRQQ
ncbi:NEL-type E3 ubiquitin ligase domain-containing protein [Pseudomonas sp. O64]|uniref:NEL-type E3 ubiquitin ligase domain-containing protein n=1 Tax=unclassified Pseudomonas TaxID=196821 RepID=UPI00387B0A34